MTWGYKMEDITGLTHMKLEILYSNKRIVSELDRLW